MNTKRIAGAAAVLLAFGAGTSAAAPDPVPDTVAQRAAACVVCHGKEGRATSDGYYPRIAGKPDGYLYNQLINFREGRRQFPSMTYMVDNLPDKFLREIAEYFAGEHPPYPPPTPVSATPAMLERGRTLVTQGDNGKNIPSCNSCHGNKMTGTAPNIPGLVGLPRDYLNAQFGAWRGNTRRSVAPDCMATITQRLSNDDISAVTAWLASQTVPADPAPAPANNNKLPIPCGSAPAQAADNK